MIAKGRTIARIGEEEADTAATDVDSALVIARAKVDPAETTVIVVDRGRMTSKAGVLAEVVASATVTRRIDRAGALLAVVIATEEDKDLTTGSAGAEVELTAEMPVDSSRVITRAGELAVDVAAQDVIRGRVTTRTGLEPALTTAVAVARERTVAKAGEEEADTAATDVDSALVIASGMLG